MSDADEIKKALTETRDEMRQEFKDIKTRLAELEKWRTFLGGVVFAATTIGAGLAWLWHELKAFILSTK